MLIICPISSLGDAYKRFLSDVYKKKHVAYILGKKPSILAYFENLGYV